VAHPLACGVCRVNKQKHERQVAAVPRSWL
jgi:hypothetical protein